MVQAPGDREHREAFTLDDKLWVSIRYWGTQDPSMEPIEALTSDEAFDYG